MTLSSSDFATSQIESDQIDLVVRRSASFLDRFFSVIAPVTGLVERFIRWSLLTFVDPEKAHNLTLKFLPLAALTRYRPSKDDERLNQRVFGLNFKNPIGVAAGVDKDAEKFLRYFNVDLVSLKLER